MSGDLRQLVPSCQVENWNQKSQVWLFKFLTQLSHIEAVPENPDQFYLTPGLA